MWGKRVRSVGCQCTQHSAIGASTRLTVPNTPSPLSLPKACIRPTCTHHDDTRFWVLPQTKTNLQHSSPRTQQSEPPDS